MGRGPDHVFEHEKRKSVRAAVWVNTGGQGNTYCMIRPEVGVKLDDDTYGNKLELRKGLFASDARALVDVLEMAMAWCHGVENGDIDPARPATPEPNYKDDIPF